MYVLIGKVFKDLVNYLIENDIEYVALLDKTKQGTNMGAIDMSKVEYVDIEDFNGLVEKCKKFENIEAFLCVYDRYILTLSRLAEALNVPGINREAALAGTDKFYMRKLFDAHDKNLSPDFALIEKEEDLTDFIDSHEFPLILKPTNLSKSLFVTKNHNKDELLQNYRHMIKELPGYIDEMTVEDGIGIIAEEFMEGYMYTVAGFAGSNGEIKLLEEIGDIKTGIDIGQTENYLYSRNIPSELPESDQLALKETARSAMQAMKMKNSAAHIDLMLTPKGPRVIEIGARPGGYRARMYGLASGVDFYGAYLNASSGKSFDVSTKQKHATATIEVFPEERGIIKNITSYAELEQLSTLSYLSNRIKIGEEAGLPSQGFKSVLIITLASDDPAKVFVDKKFIDDNIRIVLE